MTKEEMLALRAMMAEVVDDKVNGLRAELKEDNQQLSRTFDDKLEAMEKRLTAKIETSNSQLLMQVAELLENQTTKLGLQYEHEVAGKINALNEETDILRDDVKDHEQRIHTVERKVGIAI